MTEELDQPLDTPDEQEESTSFDINDPALMSAQPEEYDPDAIPVTIPPPPPQDGTHLVVARLDDRKEGGAVYVKGDKDPDSGRPVNVRVVAALNCRLLRADKTEGAYLKTWYPTTKPREINGKKERSSQLTGLCAMAGKPMPPQPNIEGQKNFILNLFAEAGEQGVPLSVKTRWVASRQKVDGSGMPVYNGTAKVYEEIKGMSKIGKLTLVEALREVSTWSQEEGETLEALAKRKQEYVDFFQKNPHAYVDHVGGQILYARVEVVELSIK